MAAKGDAVPLAVDQWYDFHEFGCHLGNVGSGRVFYGSHLITNLEKAPNPIVKLLWRISRSGPGFSVNRLAAMASFNDRKAVRAYVLDQLRERPPAVFVPPHGDLVEGADVADRLTRLVEGW